jgi:hypothetical protein
MGNFGYSSKIRQNIHFVIHQIHKNIRNFHSTAPSEQEYNNSQDWSDLCGTNKLNLSLLCFARQWIQTKAKPKQK